MATTRIIPMHMSKGKTIAQCLKARTDYAKNPDKTDGGILVSAYACDPQTVDAEFLLSKRAYWAITGRKQKRDVIAYQLRQSFVPGEITPDEANRLGQELARRFTKGQHAYIVCTHIDKKHVHNHIIWNSVSLDCNRKFCNFWGSSKAIQKLNDVLCAENGYQDYGLVVAMPNGRPADDRVIEKAFQKLKEKSGLPNVVFHSLRHSSTTYKLKLNHGDMKATQGDTGHAQLNMIADVYAHILDEDRKVNAQKFESMFYANPDLGAVKSPITPAVQSSLDLRTLVAQIQQSPELAKMLAEAISQQGKCVEIAH